MTTPVITFNTVNNGIYLDSNRLFFKVAGAFNFGIDSTGVLGNGFRINGAASNNVTTPIFVPSRVSSGSNSGLGGNNAGDISLITSGSTRSLGQLGPQVGITLGSTVKLSASFGGH